MSDDFHDQRARWAADSETRKRLEREKAEAEARGDSDQALDLGYKLTDHLSTQRQHHQEVRDMLEGRARHGEHIRQSNIGKHSRLTQEERDNIGKLVLAKLHDLLPDPEPDRAKGKAYDTAHAWGVDQYGDRMPARNEKYPARYFVAYLNRHGLTDPVG